MASETMTRDDIYREFAKGEDADGLYHVQMDEMADEIIRLRTTAGTGASETMTLDADNVPEGFAEYIAKNYNGTVEFHDPRWHAKRIWRSAVSHARAALAPQGVTAAANIPSDVAAMAAFYNTMRDRPDNEISAAMQWLASRFAQDRREKAAALQAAGVGA